MSLFVTRPPSPLPAILRTSTRCSRAIFRTTGESRNSRASAADHGFVKPGALVVGGGVRRDTGAGAGVADLAAGARTAEVEAPGEAGGAGTDEGMGAYGPNRPSESPSPCAEETGAVSCGDASVGAAAPGFAGADGFAVAAGFAGAAGFAPSEGFAALSSITATTVLIGTVAPS